MSAPAQARRISPRVPVELSVTLTRAKGSPVEGRLLDLGRGGMRVACGRPLRVDDLLTFSMQLQDGTQVEGRARVLREDLPHTYGLRFEGLGPDVGAKLARTVFALQD